MKTTSFIYSVICKREGERFGTPVCAYMNREAEQRRADEANANRSTFEKFYFISAIVLHN